jgi:hypothetical protein
MDPYMSGEVIGGSAPIISDQIIGPSGTPLPGSTTLPGSTSPVQPDNFSARKFDSDGNRILWEQPLPPGANSL